MKSCKHKSTFRLSAFLLFLSMLLSTVAVFPSSVYAVETENEPVATEQPTQQEEELSLQAQSIDTVFERELQEFRESAAATASVVSTPVRTTTENTSIVPAKGVDMIPGQYQNVRVRTTLSGASNITASVDNASILTVQAMTNFNNGDRYFKVTAKQVGIATMKATVTCSNNTTEVVTIDFYVTMDDGIYAIRNSHNYFPTDLGDYYLRAEGLYKENPDIYTSTNTYGGITKNIYRYWQINYNGYGEYYIRPIANLDYYLGVDLQGNEIEMKIGDSTSLVWKEWIIRYSGSGYEIACSFWDSEGIAANATSTQIGTYGIGQYYYYTTAGMYELEHEEYRHWQFISSDISGVYFRSTSSDTVLETLNVTRIFDDGAFDLNDLGYKVVAFGYDETTGYPRWSSGSTAIATVNATTGRITPQKGGTVTVTVSIYGTQLSAPMTVTFKMIEDGTYFLRNLQNGMYADIEGGTMSNGTKVEQQTFDGANTQKWIFTHVGSNVYTIRSTKNNSYYLGIQNDSTADDTPIVLRTGTVTNGMKWKVEKANQGYKIVSYSNSTRVLCTSTASATAGSNLKLSDFQSGNVSYQDEWLLSLPSSQLRLEGQQTDKWCWVASAKIASYRYQDSPITQACAAVYVKLNNTITMHPDTIEEFSNIQTMTGSTEDIKEALEYITGVECFKAWKYIYSEGTLQSLLDNNIPVIITRGVYEPKGSGDATKENSGMERTSGHATVINSYRWNDAINDYEYEIYDPWEPNIGNIKYCTYEQIYNGVTSDYDNKIWDGVVTFAQGNYSTLENWSGTQ